MCEWVILAANSNAKRNNVRFYPSKEQHNGGRCNKTILSQPSPSEDQQQLHVVVRAWAADECTRMAHTKNKKLPKIARRISFQPNPEAVQSGVTGWASLSCVHSLHIWQAAHPEGGLRLIVCTALQKKMPCCRPSDCGNLEMVLITSPTSSFKATAMHPVGLLRCGCGKESMWAYRTYVKCHWLNSNWP